MVMQLSAKPDPATPAAGGEAGVEEAAGGADETVDVADVAGDPGEAEQAATAKATKATTAAPPAAASTRWRVCGTVRPPGPGG
jgi:hypothetical protein